ncbi:hypothetical protein [Yersinia frederiksenii]|uniref:hypothetical protein n=1 Tax=Yersinia frederiksenii TaxID=29484 RepID=UPI00119F8015|nr:hypothetical protein [Yersinia frederiksenii]
MKRSVGFIFPIITVALLSGCVVEPARYEPGVMVEPNVVIPPRVVYVAPHYPRPAPGYEWRYREGHNWGGGYHPQYGWHRRG